MHKTRPAVKVCSSGWSGQHKGCTPAHKEEVKNGFLGGPKTKKPPDFSGGFWKS